MEKFLSLHDKWSIDDECAARHGYDNRVFAALTGVIYGMTGGHNISSNESRKRRLSILQKNAPCPQPAFSFLLDFLTALISGKKTRVDQPCYLLIGVVPLLFFLTEDPGFEGFNNKVRESVDGNFCDADVVVAYHYFLVLFYLFHYYDVDEAISMATMKYSEHFPQQQMSRWEARSGRGTPFVQGDDIRDITNVLEKVLHVCIAHPSEKECVKVLKRLSGEDAVIGGVAGGVMGMYFSVKFYGLELLSHDVVLRIRQFCDFSYERR